MKARISRGAGFKGALLYVSDEGPRATGKKRPELIGTNLPGSDTSTFAAAFGAFKRLRPDIKRQVWHSSLRLPAGERLPSEKWAEVVAAYLQKMGFDDATPYVVVRHNNDVPDGDHVHIILSRVNSRAEVWLGQHEVHRAIEATQQLEREFGLTLTPGLGDADAEAKAARPKRKADSQSVINANRSKGQRRVDTSGNARVLLGCASRSRDLPSFTQVAAAAGFAILPNRSKTTGYVSGLSVLVPGRKKYLKLGDATGKDLTWPKLLKIFEQNDQVAEAARLAARVVVDAADRRAVELVAARLDKQPEPAVPHPARALPPSAANRAKEAAIIMTDDTLAFLNLNLNPPPKPRPDGLPLDDAELRAPVPAVASATRSPSTSSPAEDAAERRRRHDEEVAVFDMQAALRKLTIAQLLDLRSTVPPFLLSAAALERLVNLMIRLLSCGLVNRVNSLSDALSARHRLREYGEAELAQRRKSPASAADRLTALSEYQSAVQARDGMLGDRARQRKKPDPQVAAQQDRARETRRQQIDAGFDRLQVSRGHQTIVHRKKVLAAAEEEQIKAAEADAEPVASIGFGLVRVPMSRARMAATAAAAAARKKRIEAAFDRRQVALTSLNEFLQQVENSAVREEREREVAHLAEAANEEQERADLAIELRELPAQLQEARRTLILERRATPEPTGSGVGAATSSHVPPAHVPPALDQIEAKDEDAAETEREALRRLARRG